MPLQDAVGVELGAQGISERVNVAGAFGPERLDGLKRAEGDIHGIVGQLAMEARERNRASRDDGWNAGNSLGLALTAIAVKVAKCN